MKTFLVVLLLSLSGCSYVAPDISKALTEEKQAKIMERQVKALERIADCLERQQ
mgnify:CR=1 FL=1